LAVVVLLLEALVAVAQVATVVVLVGAELQAEVW
jgi:hypothetical protein